MLSQVADGVWVRQSAWVQSNATVIRTDDGLILVDPGIDGADLDELADDIDRLGIPVVAGFSTHPHWDHQLWHPRFGDVPRYATAANVQDTAADLENGKRDAAETASGIPLDLIGLATELPAAGGLMPGEIIEHKAHAPGHAAVLLSDRGVLIVGDMLSDILVPIIDRSQPDPFDDYEAALDRLEEAATKVSFLIPGHGAVAEGPAIADRFAVDRAYLEGWRCGERPHDTRWGQ
jgi:glyoxylase-like metal-dependent hydrolase (beta-lactamase superfamily II)